MFTSSLQTSRHQYSAAIVALSPSADNSYLAYPSPVPSPALSQATSSQQPTPPSSAPSTGDVLLFSTRSLTVANVIQAHKSPISFLSINSSGTMLATASEKGTVIRVWSIPGAEKLYQFRRGTREARIYSLNFNIVSTLLVVSSAHDTVHIFKLGQGQGQGRTGVSTDKSPSSPSGSIDSREGSQGLDGGYESYVEKRRGGSVSYVPPPLCALWLGLFTRDLLLQVNIAAEIAASDEELDVVRRWLPPEYAHGDVGALTRFCVPPATDERRAVYRCTERVRVLAQLVWDHVADVRWW